MDEKLRAALESDVHLTHRRFCAAMETRLPAVGDDTLERYFALLSSLVQRLEDGERSLADVAQETMPEAAGFLMQEMQAASRG